MRIRNMAILLLTVVITLLTLACELKRSNPLDPTSHNDIVVPPKVIIVSATGSGANVVNKFIEITWERNDENTDGYYIYLGLAYNSAYAVVDTFIGNPVPESGTTLSKKIDVSAPGHYYLKMSAYKTYPDGNLEGPLSQWTYAYVAN
ncbi:MAG: hypothetical protein ACE14O_04565 [Candidatus Cloacimonadaceae bacterium]